MCVADVAKYYIFLLCDFFSYTHTLCVFHFFLLQVVFSCGNSGNSGNMASLRHRSGNISGNKIWWVGNRNLGFRRGKSRHKAICMVLPIGKRAATFQRQHFSGNISAATFQRQHFSGNISAATWRHYAIGAATFQRQHGVITPSERQHFSGNISAATFQRSVVLNFWKGDKNDNCEIA